jgi:prepilin-type N-terminal cleavage/methylation domain-containing protein
MTPLRPHAGFVLIELVTTLVLVGVIGAFAGFFLWSGINGYLASKRNSETALAAQVALDRISYELRHIASLETSTAPPVLNTSITYRSTLPDLTGARRLRYDSQIIYFSRDGGVTEKPLLKNVSAFRLCLNSANLDNDAGDNLEISAIRVGFNVVDVGTPFDVRIYPRVMIANPPSVACP